MVPAMMKRMGGREGKEKKTWRRDDRRRDLKKGGWRREGDVRLSMS